MNNIFDDYDHNKRKEQIRQKKIYVLKHFIGFLEIWAQENYGENTEINWDLVTKIVMDNSVFDFNTEYENIIYPENESYRSELFRDKVYAYIEKHVLDDNMPIHRLFHLSDHLSKILEKEYMDQRLEIERNHFNNHKCYRCKHFKNEVRVLFETLSGYTTNSIEKFRKLNPDKDISDYNLEMEYNCGIRVRVEDNLKKSGIITFLESGTEKVIEILNKKYPGLADAVVNPKKENRRIVNFYPIKNEERCACFEETITFDEYKKKYIEVQ